MKLNPTLEDVKDMHQRLSNAEDLFNFILENVDLDSHTKEKIAEYLRYEAYAKTVY